MDKYMMKDSIIITNNIKKRKLFMEARMKSDIPAVDSYIQFCKNKFNEKYNVSYEEFMKTHKYKKK